MFLLQIVCLVSVLDQSIDLPTQEKATRFVYISTSTKYPRGLEESKFPRSLI